LLKVKKNAILVAESKQLALEKALKERDLAIQENICLVQKNCSLGEENSKLKSFVENCESRCATLKGEKDLCALEIKSLELDLTEANRKLEVANAKIDDVTFAIENLKESFQREKNRVSKSYL